jgi:hypothetical protein
MLYPAELRARVAILPKFSGGDAGRDVCGASNIEKVAAAKCAVAIAANERDCDGAKSGLIARTGNTELRGASGELLQRGEKLVGLGRLELPTSPLSVVKSPVAVGADE